MTTWLTKNANGIRGPFEFQDLRDKLHAFPSDTQFQLVGSAGWIGMSSFAFAKSEKELLPPPPPLPQQMLKDSVAYPSSSKAKPANSSDVATKPSDANRRNFLGGLTASVLASICAIFGAMKKGGNNMPVDGRPPARSRKYNFRLPNVSPHIVPPKFDQRQDEEQKRNVKTATSGI